MIEAQNSGYSLPVNFLANWKKFQRNKALTWTSYESNSNDQIQAYRLYTLALAKVPELGAMNRLKELKNLSSSARWRLAGSYALIGQKSVALQLIQNQPLTVSPYQEMDMTYGSEVRDQAMILETLVLLEDKIRANIVMQSICQQLGSEQWMSTQTTAYALLSITKHSGKISDNKSLNFSYTINGKNASHNANARLAQIPVNIVNTNLGTIEVTNKGGQLLYARLILRGQPEVGDKTTAEKNLKLEIVYSDMNDNPINPNQIEQGTDFKAEVSISNPGILGNYTQMALSQIFPSGWEIHNTRMANADGLTSKYSIPRYEDIRDDRVYTYFSLPAKQKVTYVVLLNASYLGKFYLPSVSCEAMYNGQIGARTAGMWVEVVPRKASTKQLAQR
jgi:uncharacterized protein YfaS (alpha-2-macroglobulin family)